MYYYSQYEAVRLTRYPSQCRPYAAVEGRPSE